MTTASPAPGEVARQLEKILAHSLFAKSQRLAEFLRFIVQATLDGHTGDLKEYTIGVEVFGRSGGYSPQQEPVVRIMAGRLRARLAEYYLGPGAADPVEIELARGGYVPRFRSREREPASVQRPSPFQRTTLVGRHSERLRLDHAFSSLSGGGSVVTVTGDAGMGKTSFVEEFLGALRPGSGLVIGRGCCSERLADSDAFAPILEVLDGFRGAGGSALHALQSLAPSWYAQITSPEKSRPQSHERMRREFVACLRELARTSRVILFFDDLHWADASTCDLLAYLGQRLRDSPILILATFRPGAILASGHPFLPAKLSLERSGRCENVALPLLSQSDVNAYLDGRFPGHGFPREFATTVRERTEGHPMFLTDLSRHLVDTGVLSQQDGQWRLVRSLADVRGAIPAGTHAMIGTDLAGLGAVSRDILLCGAVQGMEFDSAVVAQVLDIDPAVVEDELRSLSGVRRLVTEIQVDDRPDRPLSVRFRFLHIYYQNALYDALTPSRRAAMSRAVASALENLAGTASPALSRQLAVLYENGRDHARAAAEFLNAARNAARVFAYPETVLLCERGIRSMAALAESAERDGQELAYRLTLGMAYMSTRGYAAPEVESTYRRARELCIQRNEGRRLVPVLWAIHTCVTNAGNLIEALPVALEMLDVATALDDRDPLVQALHAVATTYAFMGRIADARAAFDRILEVSPVDQHQFRGSLYVLDPLVTSLSMSGRLLTLAAATDLGMARARQAVALSGRLGHPQSTVYAEFWIGWIHHAIGEYAAAREHLESAMGAAREHGLPLLVEWSRVVRGSVLAHLGRSDEGIQEIRKSMERQDSMGAKLERPYCLTLLAEALLPTAPEESLSLCMQAVEIAGATHAHDFRPETRRIRAEALCALGRSGECAAEFEAGLMEARRDGSVLLEQRLLRSYSRCRSAPVVVRREALSLPPPPATALAVSRRCPSSEN